MAINATNTILNQYVPPIAIKGYLEEGHILIYDEKARAFINKGQSDAGTVGGGEGYRIAEANEFLWINRRYFVNSSIVLFLPSLTKVLPGDAITMAVGVGVAPTVITYGAQPIMFNSNTSRDRVELEGIDSELNIISDGTHWVLLAEQEISGGTF